MAIKNCSVNFIPISKIVMKILVFIKSHGYLKMSYLCLTIYHLLRATIMLQFVVNIAV